MFNQHDCLTNTPVHIICIYIYIYPFHIKIQRERERERANLERPRNNQGTWTGTFVETFLWRTFGLFVCRWVRFSCRDGCAELIGGEILECGRGRSTVELVKSLRLWDCSKPERRFVGNRLGWNRELGHETESKGLWDLQFGWAPLKKQEQGFNRRKPQEQVTRNHDKTTFYGWDPRGKCFSNERVCHQAHHFHTMQKHWARRINHEASPFDWKSFGMIIPLISEY